MNFMLQAVLEMSFLMDNLSNITILQKKNFPHIDYLWAYKCKLGPNLSVI